MPSDIETLRAKLHDLVDDSIDSLIDDDYDDAADDIERVERLSDQNLVHLLWEVDHYGDGPFDEQDYDADA